MLCVLCLGCTLQSSSLVYLSPILVLHLVAFAPPPPAAAAALGSDNDYFRTTLGIINRYVQVCTYQYNIILDHNPQHLGKVACNTSVHTRTGMASMM